ncbi:transglutaminase N-terminal domain-containing protein [Camelimonas abortus]|uniref:Transglutaminase N-terminal domain-containing protein n=1 Tax=Camelimonas abortus TaxID=1017184 RepID=A0ABV7LC88_9HYPH
MRIRIAHTTTYRYDQPARRLQQILRLTPRSSDSQHVRSWRVIVRPEVRLRHDEDMLGNHLLRLCLEGPTQEISISVSGEVQTSDTHGILRGVTERFPPALFLRETALARADASLRDFAREAAGAPGRNRLDVLHDLMRAIHQRMIFDPRHTHAATTAAEAFALGRGVCQDLTHVFIAACRTLDIPARYVSGYFVRNDGVTEQEAAHAWAEAHDPLLGWVGFDPANCICPTDAHVRVAVGLDYNGAAPVRGSRSGGGAETLDVALTVAQASRQGQA